MNRVEANEFAANWISAWNRKDVSAVLEHYVEDAKFVSPKAARFVGNPIVEGKKALAKYWSLAAKTNRKNRIHAGSCCLGCRYKRIGYFLRGESQWSLQPRM